MKNITRQYIGSITWSATEAIIFQGVLLGHQAALFYCVPAAIYGFTGTLFGLIYFTAKLFDLGISKSLMAFYHTFSSHRRAFIQFFIQQLLPNIIFCSLFFLCIALISIFFNNRIYNTLPIDGILLTLSCTLALTESTKVILKRLLQLSYNFRCAALCEIGFIMCYPLLVWAYYFYTGLLNEYSIIGFCVLLSFIEVIILSSFVYRYYLSLTDFVVEPISVPFYTSTFFSIFSNRLYIYGHSMSKQLSSGNVLIPLCAYVYGLEYAAILKLASYTTHSITSIMEKIIDPSSSALLTAASHESMEHKEKLFSLALQTSSHILLCILIFIIINNSMIFAVAAESIAVLPFIIVYFLIHYSESFFITIEKFYIAHNQSKYLIIGAALNSIAAMTIFTNCLSPLLAFMLFLVSRIITYIILLYFLSRIWRIKVRIKLIPRYIIGSLIISIACKIIF